MSARKPSPDDLLTAQDIIAEYGLNPTVAESLMRNLAKRGLLETIDGFRRDFVRRKHVEPQPVQSGGSTCE